MLRSEYVFAAPVVETQADRASILLIEIAPQLDIVKIIVQRMNKEQFVGTLPVTLKVAHLDEFLAAATSLPGEKLLEKLLSFLVVNQHLPGGGRIATKDTTIKEIPG